MKNGSLTNEWMQYLSVLISLTEHSIKKTTSLNAYCRHTNIFAVFQLFCHLPEKAISGKVLRSCRGFFYLYFHRLLYWLDGILAL